MKKPDKNPDYRREMLNKERDCAAQKHKKHLEDAILFLLAFLGGGVFHLLGDLLFSCL